MNKISLAFFACGLLGFAVGCSVRGGAEEVPPSAVGTPVPRATPGKNFTAADIEKIKWIAGTWKGMDGETPFYERYSFDGTTMVVEGLKADGSVDGEASRYELKNGEFGKGEGEKRTGASEITDAYVQFVPGVGAKGNNYRFTRQSDGSWHALLEWQPKDQPAQSKTYKMEKWAPEKK